MGPFLLVLLVGVVFGVGVIIGMALSIGIMLIIESSTRTFWNHGNVTVVERERD